MGDTNSWEGKAQTWRAMPRASSVRFFAGVFCLFAALNQIIACMAFQSQSLQEMIANILVSGTLAVMWAYAGTRRVLWMLVVTGFFQFTAFSALAWLTGPHHPLTPQEMQHKLLLNGLLAIFLIGAGYILFILFFNLEGARFFRTQTEVRLAGEIHRTLVPARHETIGNIELFGTSIPSSEVGGDLFDFVEVDGHWHAYVADVSGHGVAAGILMSMTRSAASMQLNKLKHPGELLADLNDVMQPFTAPSNYLTFAYVGSPERDAGSDSLNFALAGHLPILHYQAQSKSIVEHATENVPIGLFKNLTFASSQLVLHRGDLLAIITDGFTEVFDAKEQEMGLDTFKSMLLAWAEKPLPEIYRELRAATMKFGEQTDDQTMLLIRRLE